MLNDFIYGLFLKHGRRWSKEALVEIYKLGPMFLEIYYADPYEENGEDWAVLRWRTLRPLMDWRLG